MCVHNDNQDINYRYMTHHGLNAATGHKRCVLVLLNMSFHRKLFNNALWLFIKEKRTAINTLSLTHNDRISENLLGLESVSSTTFIHSCIPLQ